ncbi:hypothetical protein QYE76_054250 [Lolium multiflorum]|uniref:Retrotransposon gag domain-containing protein n=1 Tax=Lolium multiflorum TaxID=4521 RepID=A0AAD8SXB8_LOLMU|nr:hypothetical protein QYE76_054250 [Lolium multiflorum]
MPKFQGEEDPEAYLSWVRKVDKIFHIHNYSNAKKVAMSSLEFEDYSSVWWDELNDKREANLLEPIETWEDMKEVMHTRFVPSHHKCDLFNKLTQLKQSFKSIEEHYKEMHMTMMSVNVDKREEQTMARFVNGLNIPVKRIVEFLNIPVKRIVEFLPYTNIVELLHQAIRAERQEFQDVFPNELPHGLPPLRGIEHRIDLIPGAPLPNRAAYRTNPEDTKEIQQQIQDLLQKRHFVLEAPLGPPPPPAVSEDIKNVYETRNMNKELPELFSMLKSAEVEIKKENQVLMVNKTTSFKKRGKPNKGNFKKGGKKVAPLEKPKAVPGYLILVRLLTFVTRNRKLRNKRSLARDEVTMRVGNGSKVDVIAVGTLLYIYLRD